MGRRSVANLTPVQIREKAAKAFRNLVYSTDVNLAKFKSQLHEEEAVQTIVDLMRDPETPKPLRRQCALDIVTLARGPIAPWFHDGQTINTKDIGNSGMTIEAEIEASRSLSSLHSRLDELVRQNIPPDQWPEDVRLAAGDLIGVFEATDDSPE